MVCIIGGAELRSNNGAVIAGSFWPYTSKQAVLRLEIRPDRLKTSGELNEVARASGSDLTPSVRAGSVAGSFESSQSTRSGRAPVRKRLLTESISKGTST